MKQNITKLLSVVFSLVMLATMFPLYALADDVVEITLEVTSGEDIAPAFTAAAKQAKDDSSGKIYKITVPAGTYTADSQLKLWSNTYVYMNGVTIKHTDTASNMLRFGNLSDLDSSPVSGYNGFSNIHIEGGTFDGGGLTKAIMQIGHSNNISFKGVTFKNVKNAHMIEAGGCANLTIENCTFTGFTGSWDSSTNYEAVQFEVVTTTGSHFNGYPNNNDETPCRNITVKGCTFKNLQRGIGTHTGIANSYFTNMVFENNTFENITGFAVIATNYSNSRINTNRIKNCGCGILFRTVELAHNNFYASSKNSSYHPSYVSANSQILNNSIEVTTGYGANYKNVAYGIQLAGEKLASKTGTVPAGDFRCSGVTVQGNVVNLNCTGYGIWLYGAVKNTLKSNVVNCNLTKKGKGGTGDGIRLQLSPSNTVSANTVNNNTASGYDSDMSGITLCGTSTSNTLSSNKINKVKKDGIHIEASKSNKLTSNTITSAGRDGIHSEGSASLKMTSNTVKKAKRNGISVKSGKSSKYEKNTITSCKQNGIHLEKSDSNTCNKNKITSAGKNGIALYNSKKTTLTSNTITKSKQYGMYSTLAKKKAIKKDKSNKIKKSGKKARNWK